MIPKVGQHVKCVLRNGAIAEGRVEEWELTHVQLKSLDDQSLLIITHPRDDIMLIKITLESAPVQKKAPLSEIAPLILSAREERWEDQERATYDLETMKKEFRDRLYAPGMAPKDDEWEEAVEAHDPNNPDDRKSLAELRNDLNKQERKIIAEKLKEHTPSSAYKPSATPYSYPPVLNKPRSAYQPGRIPNGHSRHSKKQGPK